MALQYYIGAQLSAKVAYLSQGAGEAKTTPGPHLSPRAISTACISAINTGVEPTTTAILTCSISNVTRIGSSRQQSQPVRCYIHIQPSSRCSRNQGGDHGHVTAPNVPSTRSHPAHSSDVNAPIPVTQVVKVGPSIHRSLLHILNNPPSTDT